MRLLTSKHAKNIHHDEDQLFLVLSHVFSSAAPLSELEPGGKNAGGLGGRNTWFKGLCVKMRMMFLFYKEGWIKASSWFFRLRCSIPALLSVPLTD